MRLLYPWFLLGLGSVIIPIAIHLLQLRRPRRVLFTNTGFIRDVDLVTRRQRKLQQLLVLMTRVLGLIALMLAFCQPFIPASRVNVTTQANVVDVLVDNSASMQRPSKGGNLFSVAIAGAGGLGKVYPNGQFKLINNGDAVTTRLVFQTRLSELRLAGGQSAFSRLNRGVETTERYNSLYIFSDFQQSTFSPVILKGLGSSREIVLVPGTSEKVGNVFVDSVWFDEAFARVSTNIGLHIRLKNGGSETVTDCPVKVFLGPQQVAAFRATVSRGQAVVSVVQVQVPGHTLARGRVVTEDAPVVFDNTYYFTMQAASIIRVVEIGPVPVAQALYKNEPLFSYAFAKPENIDYNVLRKANLVLVREVPVITGGLRDALREVVGRGGSVAVVPAGAAASHTSYQLLFKNLGTGAAEWESPGTPPELREVAMPSVRETFFRDVLRAQPHTVAMPHAAPVLHWARTGTDIMRLRDGGSYLAEFASGIGRVYVFSAPFTKEYSDFTSHALFVPVLYKLAMRSFHNEQQPSYRLTQSAIHLSLPPSSTGSVGHDDQAPFQLVRDSTKWLPVQRVQNGEVQLEVPTGLEAPGFYQVQQAGRVLTTIAFNESPKESELAAYSVEELRALVGPGGLNMRVLDGSASAAVLEQLRAEHSGQPLWRYFLGAALVCLLAEALLLRFRRPRVGTARAPVAA